MFCTADCPRPKKLLSNELVRNWNVEMVASRPVPPTHTQITARRVLPRWSRMPVNTATAASLTRKSRAPVPASTSVANSSEAAAIST